MRGRILVFLFIARGPGGIPQPARRDRPRDPPPLAADTAAREGRRALCAGGQPGSRRWPDFSPRGRAWARSANGLDGRPACPPRIWLHVGVPCPTTPTSKVSRSASAPGFITGARNACRFPHVRSSATVPTCTSSPAIPRSPGACYGFGKDTWSASRAIGWRPRHPVAGAGATPSSGMTLETVPVRAGVGVGIRSP